MNHKGTMRKTHSLTRKQNFCSKRQLHPVFCSHSVFRFIPSVSLVFHFCLFFSITSWMQSVWFSLEVTVSGSSESSSQKKSTSSSLPSWKRCPCDTSPICNQHSDQISMLENVSFVFSICRYKALPLRELQTSCEVQTPPVDSSLRGWPWKCVS